MLALHLLLIEVYISPHSMWSTKRSRRARHVHRVAENEGFGTIAFDGCTECQQLLLDGYLQAIWGTNQGYNSYTTIPYEILCVCVCVCVIVCGPS